jgi:hypothetical protein
MQVHGLLFFFFFLIRTWYSQLTADRPHGIEGSGTYTAASIITTTMSQSTQEMTAWAVFASERKGGAKSEWLQYFMGTTSEPRNNQRVGVGISTKKKNMENEYGPYILYLGRDMILTLSLDKGAETGLEVHLFSGVGRDARSIEWTCEKCNCHKQGDKDNADHANGLSITPDKLVGAEFWDKQLKKWIDGLESSRQRAGSAPFSQHPPPQQKARNPGQPNAPYLAPPPGSQWRGPTTMQFQYPHQAYGQALNPHQAYGQALNPHQAYGQALNPYQAYGQGGHPQSYQSGLPQTAQAQPSQPYTIREDLRDPRLSKFIAQDLWPLYIDTSSRTPKDHCQLILFNIPLRFMERSGDHDTYKAYEVQFSDRVWRALEKIKIEPSEVIYAGIYAGSHGSACWVYFRSTEHALNQGEHGRDAVELLDGARFPGGPDDEHVLGAIWRDAPVPKN